jgi:hypothetical protein
MINYLHFFNIADQFRFENYCEKADLSFLRPVNFDLLAVFSISPE